MNKDTENFLLLKSRIKKLNSHELFRTSDSFSKEDLKIFMEYHVFAVWDFMSIVKSIRYNKRTKDCRNGKILFFRFKLLKHDLVL